MFSEKDIQQIKERGSDIANIEQQLKKFREDFPSLKLIEAPSVSKGILSSDDSEKERLIKLYDNQSKSLDILKFVPASGAATRMFKDLFSFITSYDSSEAAYEKLTEEGEKNAVFFFLKNLEKFPFYDDLKEAYQKIHNESLEEGHLKRRYKEIIKTLLLEDGLSYGSLPKALLKFHHYPEGTRTSLEEHFVEGANYAKGNNNEVNLHFTVSPDHLVRFKKTVNAVKGTYEERFKVTYIISYSIQKPSTDTIAVDLDNNPFRNEDGSILFRPAGHGALLENLDDLNADVIFVKNIDNVIPENIQQTTYDYKKVIAGKLLEIKEKIGVHLTSLEKATDDSDLTIYEEFVFDELHISDNSYSSLKISEQIKYLIKKLNRPVRVCGMVKNDGDPGGGPFFALNHDGSVSSQIVETAQIDKNDTGQLVIFKNTTHFNPVDLVCCVKNYKGAPFNLLKYRDEETGFITQKSKDGKELKAQELPGLWNGAMSDWITLFMEVPPITFNPVKTVNDLLKKEHQ